MVTVILGVRGELIGALPVQPKVLFGEKPLAYRKELPWRIIILLSAGINDLLLARSPYPLPIPFPPL